ncbi:Transcription initiation factor TFIID [Neofusicoccum parvum]|uniref:Transcription initiation factor TFIID n=1 Tax=Neofusicoccum parvum TaxID=310453 RepID=A0ACB5SAU0_9PEZI|nr:Transcription initiation factor TFIID [Neofusicoccum parvum]
MSGNAPAPGQARPLPPGIRVNQIQGLPHLTDQQKAAYTRGVASLYEAFQKHDKDSQEYKTAANKLLEFTKKMGKEMNEWKARQDPASQQSQQPPAQQQTQPERPQSQGQQSQPPQQPQQPTQAQPASQPGSQPGPQQPPQLPQQIIQHITNFPFQLPLSITPGTPEAEAKLKEAKHTYASLLHKQEQLATNLRRLSAMAQERQNQGQEIPANWATQKNNLEQQFAGVKRTVAEFRKSQETLKQQNQQQQQQSQHQQTPTQQQKPQAQPPQQQQQPAQQTPQQPQPPSQQPNGQQVKTEPNSAAPPTPVQPQIQMGGQPNHPPQQPQQASQSYQNMGNRSEQMANPKMPIPKTLNAPPPHPVTMGPARPTLGGPSNGAPGMMGQPVIAGHPQYHLEGDENRVLSKKKLDELVRQVTGAGEANGEALSPEVEEAMLQLADDFLDNVVSSACKLAKLRETSQLEIRDIQNILERNYNIRIPGYASDEVRTVRKFQPAPGWTQKMNAVQAAKVMGGKTD